MTEALQQEIRTLRSLHNSERDPEGRVFAPLADAHRRAGELPEAVRLLNDGLARLPDFVPGHVVAAQLYVEQGLAEEAGLAARRALELDPDNVLALRSLLGVLEEKGETAEAAEVRDRLIALEPDLPTQVTAAPVRPAASPGGARDTVELDRVVGPADEAAAPVEPALGAGLSEAPESDALDVLPLPEVSPPEPAAERPPALDLELPELVPEPDATPPPSDSSPPGPDDDTVPTLGALEADQEPVYELDSLTVGGESEEVADIGLISPDEPHPDLVGGTGLPDPEPAYDLSTLAPEEPAEPTLDLAALAPDEPVEPVLDLAALAPDEPAEPVLDLAALAPDEPVEPVLDLAALAPDEPAESVLDLAALAPDGPDEPEEPQEPVFDMDALAPDDRRDSEVDEVTDIDFLSPDETDEIIIDMDALRPDRAEVDDWQRRARAAPPLDPHPAGPEDDEEPGGPDSDAAPQAEEPPEADEEPEKTSSGPDSDPDTEEAGESVYTRTLAELYVKQGAVERALRVLRHLLAADPTDQELADRITQLEEGGADEGELQPQDEVDAERPWQPEAAVEPDDVESLARDLADSGEDEHDVDSPFAWSEQETEEAPSGGPTMRDYFDGLLSWEPEEDT